MAGFTSTFPFKPLLSSSAPKPSLLSLSPFDSKLFGLRISNPDFFNSTSHFSALRCSISARYGGGGGGGSSRSGSGDYRRSKQSNSDDDQALDMSTVRSDTVRLIDARQNMVGVVSKNEAVQMALDAELDLVILSPDADPPVVRIMDYNKYRYELQKKKREQQKKSIANRVDLKELKMGYKIDVRLKAARKFLNDGDKVKIIVNLKGRENEFRNNASELIRCFQNDVGESYNRDLFLFLYFLLIIVSAITSFKIHHDKSSISGKSILCLNRHQTEEWKGWMQLEMVRERERVNKLLKVYLLPCSIIGTRSSL